MRRCLSENLPGGCEGGFVTQVTLTADELPSLALSIGWRSYPTQDSEQLTRRVPAKPSTTLAGSQGSLPLLQILTPQPEPDGLWIHSFFLQQIQPGFPLAN